MNWYVVKAVFRIVCGEGNHTHQFDEQLRLVRASTNVEALNKATGICKSEQASFRNHNNDLVVWQFIDITEMYNLNELDDGMEICSRINEIHEAGNYIDLIKHKAASMRAGLLAKMEHV